MNIRQKHILRLSLIMVLVVGLCLTGVVVLIRSRQSLSMGAAATLTNSGGAMLTPMPTRTSGNTSAYYTFEDGGTDGWMGKGHIISVANSTTRAHDGTHSLQITLYSNSASDLPFVSVPISSGGPATGQTLTAYLYLATGSTKMEAQLYVQDSKYQLHKDNLGSLASGKWVKLSLTIPGISGSVTALGVQFLVTPANTSATLYLDSVGWATISGSTPTPKPGSGSIQTPVPGGGSTPTPVATTSGGGGSAPTPTPTPRSAPGGDYTFENGGLDGWNSNGHVVSIVNTTAYAHDGSHSLKVVLYSSSPNDLPYMYVPVGSGGPVTGETLTAYLFLPGGSVNVSANLYVQDSKYQWYHYALTSLAHGQWVKLSLTVPNVSGSLTALGVQFLVLTDNTDVTVYLDSVSW